MPDESTQTSNGVSDIHYFLNADAILLLPDHDQFTVQMAQIKHILTNRTDDEKLLAAKYFAMVILKNRQHLIAISDGLEKSQKRGIANLSVWTGLGIVLVKQYEEVKEIADAEIDNTDISLKMYLSIMDGTCPDMKDFQPAQKLYWKMKAAKALTDKCFKGMDKTGDTPEADLVGGKTTSYNPENAPALNDPIMQKLLEKGERILADGNEAD